MGIFEEPQVISMTAKVKNHHSKWGNWDLNHQDCLTINISSLLGYHGTVPSLRLSAVVALVIDGTGSSYTCVFAWIKALNIELKTIKLLEENIAKNLLDTGQCFFGYDTKSTSNKSKYQQVGLHQTKKFLHNKEKHQQNEKAIYKTGENICKPSIWLGVNIQNT